MQATLVFGGGVVSPDVPKGGLLALAPPGSAGDVTVDWGDGSDPQTFAFDGANSPITVSHAFPSARGQPGCAWTVTVTAPDGTVTTLPVVVR